MMRVSGCRKGVGSKDDGWSLYVEKGGRSVDDGGLLDIEEMLDSEVPVILMYEVKVDPQMTRASR